MLEPCAAAMAGIEGLGVGVGAAFGDGVADWGRGTLQLGVGSGLKSCDTASDML